MALQSVKGVNFIPGEFGKPTGAISLNSILLDASDEHCGAIFRIPRTGTLSKIGIRTSTTATAVGTLRVGLEGVDLTTGRPDGTISPANAYGDQSSFATSTCYWISLNSGNGVSVTKDILTAIACRWQSYTSGGLSLATLVNSLSPQSYPYTYSYLGAVWAFQESVCNFALEYSDGVIEHVLGMCPAVGVSSVSWNSGSNPDRRGLKFKTTYPFGSSGCSVILDNDSDCDIILYDSDGSTVLETITVDKDVRNTTSVRKLLVPFSLSRTFAKDTFYRLVILPKDVPNVTIGNLTVTNDGSNAAMNAVDGGVDFYYTTCNGTPTGEGSWTDTLTTRPPIGLAVDRLDDGVGGGGNSGLWGMIR